MKAQRAAEFTIDIDSENPGVGRVVITIADALRLRRQDQSAMEIGPVAHRIKMISVLRRFDEPVIDAIKQPCPPHRERSLRYGPGLHLILPHSSKQLPREKTLTVSLTVS